MPKYQTELFGQVIYSADISYEDLLVVESAIQAFITRCTSAAGGVFLTFEAEGDRTFFQCAFQSCDPALAEKVARQFAEFLDKNIEGKLMFVDRLLKQHLFYSICNKKVQFERIDLPLAGPIDQALREKGA